MEKGVAKIPERRSRGEDGNKRHGDSAIAGALAWYASTLNPMVYGYTPARGRRLFDERPAGPATLKDDDADDAMHAAGRFRRASGWFGLR